MQSTSIVFMRCFIYIIMLDTPLSDHPQFPDVSNAPKHTDEEGDHVICGDLM
jgi:hypothetical protein